jgi:mannose-6-phosphate isomerase
VTVVVAGAGLLTTGTDAPRTTEVARGDVLLVPYGAGDVRLEGDVTVVRCMPPA